MKTFKELKSWSIENGYKELFNCYDDTDFVLAIDALNASREFHADEIEYANDDGTAYGRGYVTIELKRGARCVTPVDIEIEIFYDDYSKDSNEYLSLSYQYIGWRC